MGANIYPEDVEQALFSDSAVADRLGSFALELRDIGARARTVAPGLARSTRLQP